MGRTIANRHLDEALRRTLQRLEGDFSLDLQDPAFIELKRWLLQRVMTLEDNGTEAQSKMKWVQTRPKFRLVQIFEQRPTEINDDNEATA
jgi:hypothetical protein